MATLVHKCPHCLAERMTFQVLATSIMRGENAFTRNFVHLQCGDCGLPSAAEISDGNAGSILGPAVHSIQQSLGLLGWQVRRMWPQPPAPRIPEHLPDAVLKAFSAAEATFPHTGLEEASAGSYGRALDVGTKILAPEFAGNLYGRIKNLAGDGRITNDLAEWAHAIRLIRNDALHEIESVSKDELVAIRGFTELLLTYLFTLPGMLKARLAETSEKPT